MDFHGMKRKRLQSLCKKHGIPANLKNKEMADRLSFIFKGKANDDPLCSYDNARPNVEIIDLVSPSPGSEKNANFSGKLSESSGIERLEFKMNLSPEITRDDLGICVVEESVISGLNKEPVNENQEGLHSSCDGVALEEFYDHLEGGEVEKLGDKTNVEDVCGIREAETEGSNQNDLNALLVSPEESGYPIVEGEVHESDDPICDHGAACSVVNGRSEVDSMCLDISSDAMDAGGQIKVTVEPFMDEVHLSGEVKSSDLNIHEMVVSGTVTRDDDTCEARFVSPTKMNLSPTAEKMIGVSSKLLNSSEAKVLPSENNISSEALTINIEISNMEENIQIDVNKEQENVHAAPCVTVMDEEDLVHVPSEVEELRDKNNILEDVCEDGKGRDEAVEPSDHNSPQGSNMNDINILHASQEESGYPLEEEVHLTDGNTYSCHVNYPVNNEFEVDAMDTDEKTNLTAEHFTDDVPNVPSSSFKYSDGTPDLFLTTYSLSEAKSSDIDFHEDNFDEKLKSPQCTGSVADSDEYIEFSPNNLEASSNKGFQTATYSGKSTLGDAVGTCNAKESMQSEKMEKQCRHLMEGEVEKLGDKTDVEDVCGRFEVDVMCLDTCAEAINANRRIDVTVEHFMDEGHSSSEMKSSDVIIHKVAASGTVTRYDDTCEARFVSPSKLSLSPTLGKTVGTYPKLLKNSEALVLQSEKKFSPEALTIDTEISNVEGNIQIDVNEEQENEHARAPCATILNNEHPIQVPLEEFRNHLVEGEVKKSDKNENVHKSGKGGDEAVERVEVDAMDTDEKTNLTAEYFTDNVPNVPSSSFKSSDGTLDQFLTTHPLSEVKYCDIDVHQDSEKESMQSDMMKKEYSQEVSYTKDKVFVMNSVDLLQQSVEGCNLVQGEVSRLFENSDIHDNTVGNGADDTNSPQRSNRNDMNLSLFCHMDFGYSSSEGSAGKTNMTHVIDEVHSSTFNDSKGKPVLFLSTCALDEVKSSDLNIHEMVVSGTATRNGNSSEAEIMSSREKSLSQVSEKMFGFSPKLLNNSETKVLQSKMIFSPETPTFDIELCGVREEVKHAASSVMDMVMNNENLEQVASGEFGDHMVGEIENTSDKNNHEDACGNGMDADKVVKQCGHNSPQGSNINDANLLHVSQEYPGYPLVEEVQQSGENIFHSGIHIVQNSESEVDVMSLLETTIAAKDTAGKTDEPVEHFSVDVASPSFKYSNGTPDKSLTTYPPSELYSNGLNTHEMVASDTHENKFRSSEKPGLSTNGEECIGFSPRNLEASVVKGFQAETYFDPSTLGDAATCDMKENMQSENMEEQHSQGILHTAKNVDLLQESMEECHSMQGFFGNFDVHDEAGGTGAEDENQRNMKIFVDNLEKYLLSEFKSIDDASGQNSYEKLNEHVPIMPQPCEMKSRTSDLDQISASDTVSGDEGTFQEKLESPPSKCTPTASSEDNTNFVSNLLESSIKEKLKIETKLPVKHARDVVETSDMKENVKIAKKEQASTIILKNTFPKRQPLKDLQQNYMNSPAP